MAHKHDKEKNEELIVKNTIIKANQVFTEGIFSFELEEYLENEW